MCAEAKKFVKVFYFSNYLSDFCNDYHKYNRYLSAINPFSHSKSGTKS